MGVFRVGVLASGRGAGFQSLVDAQTGGTLSAEIALLICNIPGAAAIDRARNAGIPVAIIPHKGKTREAFEEEVIQALREQAVDLVVFAGFMRIVTEHFVAAFPGRIINIHPSLLPAFPGAHAHRDVLQFGAKVTGCTVHFVDVSVDGGPILLQKAVAVRDDDTEETLAARVLAWEHVIFPWAVRLLAEGRVRVEGRTVYIDGSGIPMPEPASGPESPAEKE